jgi:hypothetical protein
MRLRVVAALAAGITVAALASNGWAADAELSAAQIVEKNVAARGGLEAWRKIQTMVWVGHMESAHAPVPSMLFVLQQKRPNKTRFDVNALGEKSERIFDGARGWKVKPSRQGGADIQPFNFEEVKFAHATQVIDGPLIDCLAKGNVVTLQGLDEIEGHKAYHLNVRLASGEIDQVWIDAQTFLDIRYDRPSSNATGPGTVSVSYRDYKKTEGLQIPSIIETGVGSGVTPDRMVIERVMLNVAIEDRSFKPPGGRDRRGGMTMGDQPQAPMRRAPIDPSATPGALRPDPASGPK